MMLGGIGCFGFGRTVGARALAAGVAIALLAAGRPAAADIPAQEVKPLVLLLLDTSGSMEYALGGSLSETQDEDSMLIPDCSAGQRSRWIVAQEVLTGTYGGYGCTLDDRSTPGSREDHNYPVPHVVPSGVQLHDGLIDMTIDRFKYGVMTFDAVPNPGLGGGGGWSYGPESGVNLGARNDTHGAPGGFVHPAASDDPADLAVRNTVVQQSILSAIPYGGTPIAPMLRDALYYFETDPDQQPWDVNAGTGDKYLGCRSRNIILVTDGRSNLGEGTDGYLTSVEYARRLKAAGITIYVIGFQLPAGVSTQMDDIADAGGTGEAFLADTAADLVSALVKILGRLETHVQSRTRVVVTEETGHDRDLQYQFNAGYGMATDSPGLRRGYLERTTYRCKTGFPGAVPYELQSLHAKLDATPDADRRIWTVVGGELVPFVEGFGVDTHVSPADLDVTAGSGWLMDFSPNAEGLCRSGLLGNASDDAVRAEFRDNLVSYIRARDTSCRAGNKLGAIVRSSPTILAHKKNVDINVPSFRLYKESDNFRN
ncbi:MAG: VWA domain-containing protein, partial [Deltaproteobacteria bacterium]|nr:VWA domain-containing protein [Deltaproteobacteria bacterium]